MATSRISRIILTAEGEKEPVRYSGLMVSNHNTLNSDQVGSLDYNLHLQVSITLLVHDNVSTISLCFISKELFPEFLLDLTS